MTDGERIVRPTTVRLRWNFAMSWNAKMTMQTAARGKFSLGRRSIHAMTFKSAVVVLVLLTASLARAAVDTQAVGKVPSDDPTVPVSSPSSASPSGASQLTEETNFDYRSLNDPPPRITVAAPIQAPPGWPLQDRISWVARLLLTIMGYVGIMFAISILRKIERQTQSVEAAVDSAAAIAQSALLHSQALVRAERPWIMVTAEPCPGIENSSRVVATNRGKSPARIISTAERILVAIDENHLPHAPEYEIEEPGDALNPIILLPGESSSLRIFGWGDVKRFCSTGEGLKRVEDWDEKIFLYGKITYEDFVGPAGQETHETSWCCWYIAGQRRSGLVTVGVPGFNAQT
jgi:hypothetical protein